MLTPESSENRTYHQSTGMGLLISSKPNQVHFLCYLLHALSPQLLRIDHIAIQNQHLQAPNLEINTL
jgi:hypothetical protein